MRLASVLVAALLLLTGCGAKEADSGRPDRLPDVTLHALTGEGSLDLGALRGPVVINLWASWCTPCRKELPEYQAFAEKYAGRVPVIGIDFQETRPDAARQLARDTGVTYPLYSDPDGRLRAIGLPKLILLDADGGIAHAEYLKITSVAQLEQLVRRHLGQA